MEDFIFTKPGVSKILKESFVEGRLHPDKTSSPFHARMLEVQASLAQTQGAPTYVIVDPKTERILAKSGGLQLESAFTAFLQEGIEASKK